MACRNMANYFGTFKEQVIYFMDFIKNPPPEPALFIIKPYFSNGSLSTYLKTLKRTGNKIIFI